jgi:hypothetical protein
MRQITTFARLDVFDVYQTQMGGVIRGPGALIGLFAATPLCCRAARILIWINTQPCLGKIIKVVDNDRQDTI